MEFNDLLFYSIKLLFNTIVNKVCQQTIFSDTNVTKTTLSLLLLHFRSSGPNL